jgi:hypothetical protein
MSTDPSSRPPHLAVGHIVRGDPGTGETAATPIEAGHQSEAADEDRTPRAEAAAINDQHERKRRRLTSPTTRRLGPGDYTLLALIALGVAITAVMAIVSP